MQNSDHSKFYKFICQLPKQIQEAKTLLADAHLQNLPQDFNKVLFTGMGGSAIGGEYLKTYLQEDSPVQLDINRNYTIPKYVGPGTLVISCSYSGNTEETLAATETALLRKASVVAISSGGELLETAKKNDLPYIKIPGGFPPRQALGYMFFPLLHLFEKLKLVKINTKMIQETTRVLEDIAHRNNPFITHGHTFCNNIAQNLYKNIPVIYTASDLLKPVVLRWRNQLNENSKVLAVSNVFPEMNHNEIMGWEAPQEVLSFFKVVFLRDGNESQRNVKRFEITRNILRDKKVPIFEVFAEGKNRLANLFSLTYIGDWVSYYLAMLYGKDPLKIESINRLKEALSQ